MGVVLRAGWSYLISIQTATSVMVKQKQRFGCVYRLTNLVTGKTYIGKTVCFKRRMYEHKRSKSKTYLHSSIRKHGWDNFKKEIIIDDVPEEDLSNLEISYIEVENTVAPNGYNLTLGGEGASGFKHTEKGREKISQAAIRRHANRDRFGCVTFVKRKNKYRVRGPCPDCKFIGLYFTKAKAEESLKHFLQTGERIESDRTRRKMGTVRKNKNGKRYVARYMKKCIGLYFTKEKAEEALNRFIETGERIESDRTRRKKGTGTIRKTNNGERYEARYTKNKKQISKRFDTPEECEEWLKTESNF